MKDNVKTAASIYKNIVYTSNIFGAIAQSINNFFKLDPLLSTKWFKELTMDQQYKFNMAIRYSLIDLLPKIAEVDKKSASEIYYNILTPQFAENKFTLISEISPEQLVVRDTHVLWKANQIIKELFQKAPVEILSRTIDLVILYKNLDVKSNSEIIEDYSSIWYDDQNRFDEISLLKSIENVANEWATNDNSQMLQVIQVLQSKPYGIAKRILCRVLLSNPTKFKHELLELITSDAFLGTFDLMDLFPKILSIITFSLEKSEIVRINEKMISINPPNMSSDGLGSFRKYLISSIPEQYRENHLKEWLEREGTKYKDLRPREPIRIEPVYEETESTSGNKIEFKDLNEYEQEKTLVEIINNSEIYEKNQKIDLLDKIDIYLYRSKEKINKNLISTFEHVVHKYCLDPDPSEQPLLNEYQFSTTLVSYPTVRASAASCIMKLTWLNPTSENMSYVEKMTRDENSFVREAVCRNLRFLSAVDYQKSLQIAKEFLHDNRRVIFFITDFLHFNVGKHPDDILEMTKKLIIKFGMKNQEGEKHEAKEPVLTYVSSLVTYMALKHDNSEFKELFEQLISNNSYSDIIRFNIAFTCKRDDLLFDENLHTKVLGVYRKLINTENHEIRDRSTFFLLNALTTAKKSLLPDIKPILDKASHEKYLASADPIQRISLIEYLKMFWSVIPEDAAIYLTRIYENNPSFVYNNPFGTDDVVYLIENLLQDGHVSKTSKELVSQLLMKLVKAGWHKAIELLGKLGSRS